MAETFTPSSSYDPKKFIDREEEIQQILTLLKQSQPRVRAVVIDGDRGVGKTWLSLHLQRTIFKEKITGVTSWLFSLWSPGENYRPEGERAQANERFLRDGEQLKLDEFLEIIINSLPIELPPNPELAEKVDSIRRYVQSHVDDRFILILDSAYESDWSLLEQLETHFLGNLLTLSNFFVIVTGRGRPYPWKVPYLIEAIRFRPGKFTVEQINEQLKRFQLTSLLTTKEIYNIGGGWPLFTEHLARSKNLNQALSVAVNILFAVVPVQEREQIRKYFEALSPLDGFGETEAALLVGNYEKNVQDGRAICRRMNETRLISWKNGRYEINEPVLKILRQHLLLNYRELWIQLNCIAFRHFELLAKERTMERFRSFFEGQMQNHANILNAAGIDDPHICSAG
ncbi:MAG: ATP-binding protein [Anaerolineaceae bacterium]|nr:MAG: ATP-binding protein [Anaerolineaceae bacterium]